jgi:hypothetical protein
MNPVTQVMKIHTGFRTKLARFLLVLYVCSLGGSLWIEVFQFIENQVQMPLFVLQHQQTGHQINWDQKTRQKSIVNNSVAHRLVHFAAEIGRCGAGDPETGNNPSPVPVFKLDQHYIGDPFLTVISNWSEGSKCFSRPTPSTRDPYCLLLLRPPRSSA